VTNDGWDCWDVINNWGAVIGFDFRDFWLFRGLKFKVIGCFE
jgi:hypothetical protein